MPRRRETDRFLHERAVLASGIGILAGVDEAGRGPLAGPVVAAAVILPRAWVQEGMPEGWGDLNDSKQLSESRREEFFVGLTSHPEVRFSIASVEPGVIDVINILQATHRAMNAALAGLGDDVEHALVDGRPVRTLRLPQTALVKGDSLSYSIAAASVLAKVTRDRVLREADAQWPGYGFAAHKGYPTPEHLEAVSRLGPCPIHRLSFAPLRRSEPELFVS
jgi:ribonuclease HII